MDKLTKRQSEVLLFIQTFTDENGFPPTRVEISQALGFRSPNAAEDHLKALARKGAITLQNGASRGIRIGQNKGLPVIGRVAAGSPILAEEHIDRHYPVPPDLFSPKADFMLQVRGMSMVNAGILDGDLLAVHRTDQVRNGQIIVARLHDEVTVKRFQRNGSKVLLIAENPDFEPIEVNLNSEPLEIEGLAVGVIRAGKPL